MDSRLRAGKLEFLVNWKGYGYEENSWVSKHNVNALQLISQFYHDHPAVFDTPPQVYVESHYSVHTLCRLVWECKVHEISCGALMLHLVTQEFSLYP